MRIKIELEFHAEFTEKMKTLAKQDAEAAVPILVRLNAARIAGALVEDECAVINHRHPMFILDTGTGGYVPVCIVVIESGVASRAYVVDYVKLKPFSEPEIRLLASRCASMAGILPVDIHVCQ